MSKSDKTKLYIIKRSDDVVYATTIMAQGEVLATVDELNNEKWLFEKFPNSIFVVKE